ncbi:MAG TPA: hypothetical protein VEF71_12695 [Streptosporangiaceae bacterium]|nr:hypothetical protein [Streptosporangiaceae bacterium]
MFENDQLRRLGECLVNGRAASTGRHSCPCLPPVRIKDTEELLLRSRIGCEFAIESWRHARWLAGGDRTQRPSLAASLRRPGAKKALAEIWGAEDKDHVLAAVKAFEDAHGAQFPRAAAKITGNVAELLTRWRAVNAPHLLALVRARACFERGVLVERHDQQGKAA